MGGEGRSRRVTSENNDTAGGGLRQAAWAGVFLRAWGRVDEVLASQGGSLIDEVRMGAQTCHADSRVLNLLGGDHNAPRANRGASRRAPHHHRAPQFRISFRGPTDLTSA